MRDVSPGLCTGIGREEFREPVPEEPKDAVRFTVTTDADETELEREEYRYGMGMEDGGSETGTDAPFPCTACIVMIKDQLRGASRAAAR